MGVLMAKQPTKPGSQESGEKERSGRRTAAVQVEKELARMAAVIASHDGITQSDLVSPVLRPFLKMHFERVQKEIQARLRQMDAEDR